MGRSVQGSDDTTSFGNLNHKKPVRVFQVKIFDSLLKRMQKPDSDEEVRPFEEMNIDKVSEVSDINSCDEAGRDVSETKELGDNEETKSHDAMKLGKRDLP